jgi:hypothetical protein
VGLFNLVIHLDGEHEISAIGIGNADGVTFSVTFNDQEQTVFPIQFTANGLYLMPHKITASVITLESDSLFIGRFAAGIGITIPTSVAKEPGFVSTCEPRRTLSGQIIPGAGGYIYRILSLDSRYKITDEALHEIWSGYKFIGMGYPFFIDLAKEAYKLPFNKFYATERNQREMNFEGGIRKFLYSRRWEFEEAF